MSLDSLRKEIDEIDILLQELFEKRMALCDNVAQEKKRTNAPVLEGGREEQILSAVRERSSGFEESSQEFFKKIMAISRKRQKKFMASQLSIPKSDKVNVIIACGGSSSRMGFNKLLYEIGGEAVILRTIRKFHGLKNISRIILSCGKQFRSTLEKLVASSGFSTEILFTDGGETRQESVAKGVEATEADCGWICVHDGARPLIEKNTILSCINDAKESGAAVVCVPVKDTIKISDNLFAEETPCREKLFSAQTPQVIAKNIYLKAYEQACAAKICYTDDVSLCEAIGIYPKITMGSYSNIKLTTEEDISVMETTLKKEG